MTPGEPGIPVMLVLVVLGGAIVLVALVAGLVVYAWQAYQTRRRWTWWW